MEERVRISGPAEWSRNQAPGGSPMQPGTPGDGAQEGSVCKGVVGVALSLTGETTPSTCIRWFFSVRFTLRIPKP